jgi:glycosyltransferase involved in cell wall biosynthesis
MSSLPLVSIVVLGYKQDRYIRDAVRSALAQTYENLEIILSDDASPDRTFDIMKEEASAYRGPHRLILNRNPVNLGLTGNLSRAAQLASGDLIVEQDGDDISLPVRASKLVQRWLNDEPRCDLVFSRDIRIGADGEVLQEQKVPLPVVTLQQFIRGKFFIAGGCVASYSRSLFERFGPINPAIKYTDLALTFRALLGSGCAFIDEPLVYYRIHPESIVRKGGKLRGRVRRRPNGPGSTSSRWKTCSEPGISAKSEIPFYDGSSYVILSLRKLMRAAAVALAGPP